MRREDVEGQEARLKKLERGGKWLEAVRAALLEGLRMEEMLQHLKRALNRKRRLQGARRP